MHRKTFQVDGVEWAVFDVSPERTPHFDPALRDGWLGFESDAEHRRLGPIPPNWQRSTRDELAELLEAATYVHGLWREQAE